MENDIYASILAHACNFGLEQMAHVTNIAYDQLAWCTTWYMREDTLKAAFTNLVNYHHSLPLSHRWGSGMLSSSDGQRFPVSGKNRHARPFPPPLGYGMGLTFYSWTSDQLSQYGTKFVPVSVRDATYVIKNKRDLSLVKTAYRHGLRASEVGLLDRELDLDLKQGKIMIHRLKGSISGKYPMQPDELKIMRAYLRTRTDDNSALYISNQLVPIERTTLWRMMQTYGKLAGIPPEKWKFHALRHSIAVHLLEASNDIYFVKDWLGHSNIQNTMRYVKYTTTKRAARAREVFASHWVV